MVPPFPVFRNPFMFLKLKTQKCQSRRSRDSSNDRANLNFDISPMAHQIYMHDSVVGMLEWQTPPKNKQFLSITNRSL